MLSENIKQDYFAGAQSNSFKTALPALVALCLAGALKVASQDNLWWWEPYSYVAAAIGYCSVWLLSRRYPDKAPLWSVAIIVISLVLLTIRLWLLLSSPMLSQPGVSWFVLIFACLPILYLAEYLLLPPRPALIASIATWLWLSAVVFVVVFPEWQRNPEREGLAQLLIFFLVMNPVYIAVMSAFPEYYSALALAQDRHEQDSQRMSVLVNQLKYDPLTGALSRHHYQQIINTPRGLLPGIEAVVMLDVDNFKSYNDVLGHPAGDACLQAIVDCLNVELERQHELIRYGGEEFLLLLHKQQGIDAHCLVQRLVDAVAEKKLPHPHPQIKYVTISAGATEDSHRGLKNLVHAADKGLLRAKENGRNQVCWEQPDDVPRQYKTSRKRATA